MKRIKLGFNSGWKVCCENQC